MSETKTLAAEEAFRRGDFEAVERLCDEVLRADSANAPATLLKGMTALRNRRLPEAITLLERTLEISPEDYVAMTWLVGAYYEAARYPEAIALGQKAHALWPRDVEILIALSHAAMMGAQDLEASVSYLQEAVKLKPANPILRCKLGAALELQAKDHEAHCEYMAAIEASPKAEEAYSRLARLFMGHGNYVEALEVAKKGLAAIPASAQMHLIYAQSLRHVREYEEAEKALRKAVDLDPNITLAAAKWLEEDGRFEEAADLFEKAVGLGKNLGAAYYGIIKSRKMTDADRSILSRAEGLLATRLSLQERAAVHYALGKAANDLGEHENAMHHFDEGNAVNYRLHLSGKPYNVDEIEKWRTQTIEMATPELMAKHRHLGSESDLPIFIIGMIRSGTTLTEQILSSHPDVRAGGEQRFWLAEAPGLIDLDTQTLDEPKFLDARDRYLSVLRSLEPNAKRITDKMPMNYFVIWLIHLAYPKARILHLKRSPIDTALSIYMTDLAKPPDFAHSKRNIVAGYRDYEILMDHFSTVIQEDRMLTVQYEDLINDQEHWTRKILEFCGLDWDERCLAFYSNERQVTTPSRWQVRQPIYRSSMEKWRRYEPWLGEFAELLKEPRS